MSKDQVENVRELHIQKKYLSSINEAFQQLYKVSGNSFLALTQHTLKIWDKYVKKTSKAIQWSITREEPWKRFDILLSTKWLTDIELSETHNASFSINTLE
jgi:hypothetical protein